MLTVVDLFKYIESLSCDFESAGFKVAGASDFSPQIEYKEIPV